SASACRPGPGRGRPSRYWRRCAATRRRSAGGCGSCCRGASARWRCSTTSRRRTCATSCKRPRREGPAVSSPVSPEVRARLAVQPAPGLGPRKTAALMERFGSAAAALGATAAELREVSGLGEKLAVAIPAALETADVEAELERAARHGVHLLALGGPDY